MSCRHLLSVALSNTSAKIARGKSSALPFCFPILGAQFHWETYVTQYIMRTIHVQICFYCALCLWWCKEETWSVTWAAATGELQVDGIEGPGLISWSDPLGIVELGTNVSSPAGFLLQNVGVLACGWGARWQSDGLKRAAEEACFISCSIMKSKNNMHFFPVARFFSFQINKREKQCQIPFTGSWF